MLLLIVQIFRLEKEGKEKPNEHKGYILRRGQKKDEKVKVKEGLRSAKQQQEKKMKKEREERRKTMASLDKSSLVSYLQQEIARLEDENQASSLLCHHV